MELKAFSSTGRNTASFLRLSAMNRGSAAASAGEKRAISAAMRVMSPVAWISPPPSNTRRYCGSRRISSTSSSKLRPQAAKISDSTRGYRKKVGPMSKRKVPDSVGAVMVLDRPPTTSRDS